jgi:hypothetical protein
LPGEGKQFSAGTTGGGRDHLLANIDLRPIHSQLADFDLCLPSAASFLLYKPRGMRILCPPE